MQIYVVMIESVAKELFSPNSFWVFRSDARQIYTLMSNDVNELLIALFLTLKI